MAGAPAKFEALLTEGAEQDLEAIHDYISEFDCVANANSVLDALMEVVAGFSKFPERGSYPEGTGQSRHQRISPGLLRAVPRDLSCDRQPSHHLPDC